MNGWLQSSTRFHCEFPFNPFFSIEQSSAFFDSNLIQLGLTFLSLSGLLFSVSSVVKLSRCRRFLAIRYPPPPPGIPPHFTPRTPHVTPRHPRLVMPLTPIHPTPKLVLCSFVLWLRVIWFSITNFGSPGPQKSSLLALLVLNFGDVGNLAAPPLHWPSQIGVDFSSIIPVHPNLAWTSEMYPRLAWSSVFWAG